MCGICGAIDFKGTLDLKPSVRRMADCLAHRGPDDWDVQLYLSDYGGNVRAALGHRRLAIIDLSDSALPLYLTFGYVPTPDTFFSRIKKLEPATLMVVERNGELRMRKYWQYPVSQSSSECRVTGEEEAEVKLRDLMRDAMSCR